MAATFPHQCKSDREVSTDQIGNNLVWKVSSLNPQREIRGLIVVKESSREPSETSRLELNAFGNNVHSTELPIARSRGAAVRMVAGFLAGIGVTLLWLYSTLQ